MRDNVYSLIRLALVLTFWLILVALLRADSRAAVVRLPSHGCSGTVIATGPGQSLILSCAHAFAGQDRVRPIAVDVPTPTPAPAQQVGVQLLAVDHDSDLSLLVLRSGPLPYVAPVAPAGHRPARCWSVGYDEMKLPPQMRPASILDVGQARTHTRERPWHGRSGGALLCAERGQVVGVVSGYTGPRTRQESLPGAVGIYASHPAILRFLARYAPGQGLAPGDSFPPSPLPPISIERHYGPLPAPVPSSPPLVERFYGPSAPSPWCPGGT